MTKRQWFLNKVNPHFFYDYQKMYGERSPSDHENYVDRLLHAEDNRLKQVTGNKFVIEELEDEMKRFLAFQRMKKLKDTAAAVTQGDKGKGKESS